MLIIDNHNSHISTKFDEYYKLNNVITINILAHSFHLLQPLNVGLYLPLKFIYGCQINLFICTFINHITKTEFFITYLAAHNAVFIKKNIKGRFKGIGISLWDPDSVISKLNVHLYTPTFSSSHSSSNHQWES